MNLFHGGGTRKKANQRISPLWTTQATRKTPLTLSVLDAISNALLKNCGRQKIQKKFFDRSLNRERMTKFKMVFAA